MGVVVVEEGVGAAGHLRAGEVSVVETVAEVVLEGTGEGRPLMALPLDLRRERPMVAEWVVAWAVMHLRGRTQTMHMVLQVVGACQEGPMVPLLRANIDKYIV